MLHDLTFALWFLLPAAVANVVPIVTAVLPGLKDWQAPMDFGCTFRGKPLLGTHKTWRGFITGVLAGWFVFWLQTLFVHHVAWGWVQTIGATAGYNSLPWLVGPLLGVGALGGDALKSFFKRQVGVASGKSWIPFDQLDYIIGAVLITLPFITLSAGVYVGIFVIWFGVHLLFSYLGYKWGLKEQPI
jgi:CDP-2,3-bis-(O-geranylgeranyl)-sn-glycerol synthase